MSQNPIDFVGPSQSHSDESSLHYHRCWWAWCRDNFYSRKGLVDHVRTEHVAEVRPVPIANVSALQKAERGCWEVNTMEYCPSSLPSQPTSAKPDDTLPLSLPSPPASTPHEIPCTPVRVGSPADLEKATDSPQVPSNPAPLPQNSYGLLTPLSKHNIFNVTTPSASFASLSSQSDSPNKLTYVIPGSPCFSDLVAGNAKQPMPIIPEVEYSDEAAMSPSEVSSQEFVFNHLTQGIDGDENNDKPEIASRNRDDSMAIDSPAAVPPEEPRATVGATSQRDQPGLNGPTSPVNAERHPPLLTPLQIQPLQSNFIAPTTSPSYLSSPAYPSTTPVTRQSWYQPRRRRSSKKMSASGQASPASSPLAKSASPIISPIPANFLPEAVQAAPEPEEESWSQTDRGTQIFSYPPLQTQAPYRSQSLSQG